MTSRFAVVLARAPQDGARGAAPPGLEPTSFALAVLEDVVEVVNDLAEVRPSLACCPPGWVDAGRLIWPGTPVLDLPSAPDPAVLLSALDGLAGLGATEAVVVAGDVPDLPQLVLGKLFSALSSAAVAVCPAQGGGLVALASALPVPAWLRHAAVGLDSADALDRLRANAPDRRALSVGPGWHRLRSPADLAALDVGLEGWEQTRALLSRRAVPG
ncbi:MAG: hypothetical protein NVSMB13_21580 [Mycobacteriales bacterium]